jgi:SPP1 family holin
MDIQLIVRIIVSVIAMINAFAAAFGFDPIDVDEGTVYTAVSFVIMIGAWVWGFWKNNNFTKAAKLAQEKLIELKLAGKDAEASKE